MSEPVVFLKPGMELSIIGNCVMVKCESEDDAIMFAEIVKYCDGKNVVAEEKEDE